MTTYRRLERHEPLPQDKRVLRPSWYEWDWIQELADELVARSPALSMCEATAMAMELFEEHHCTAPASTAESYLAFEPAGRWITKILAAGSVTVSERLLFDHALMAPRDQRITDVLHRLHQRKEADVRHTDRQVLKATWHCLSESHRVLRS